MNRVKFLLASLFIPLLFVSGSTLGYSPTEDFCRNNPNATSSSVCQEQSKQESIVGNDGILITITNFISWLGGVLAVILVITAGFLYVTSGGDSNKVKKAKDIILYVAIGLFIIVISRIIVTIVINEILN